VKKDSIFIFDIVTAFGNNGDLLINKALIYKLRKFGHIRVVTTHLPSSFLEELKLSEEEQIDSFFTCLVNNVFRKNVYKVGIPGHSLESKPQYISGTLECFKTLLFRCAFGLRFLRVGTSFGPVPKFKLSEERFKSKLYTIYGLRDNESVNVCNSHSMQYFPDLAFISEDIFPVNANDKEPDTCFVSFRSKFPDASTSDDYLRKILTKMYTYLQHSGIKKVVIGYQVVEDKETSLQIMRALSKLEGIEVCFVEEMLELKDAHDRIAKSSLVLSNRLHILLPALISGVPHIALTDIVLHKKIKALYQTIDADFVLKDVNDNNDIKICDANCSANLLKIAATQRAVADSLLDKALNS
jgi:polysaccharide pyruvyl transferase WcaK-like protein